MIRRSALALVLVPAALLLAGCPSKDGGGSSSPNVNDDVWVATNAGPVRTLIAGDTAWVVNLTANSIDAVDLTTCENAQESCDGLGTVNLPASSSPLNGAIDGNNLYVVLTGFGFPQVSVIDMPSRTVVGTISTGAGAFFSPQAVAVANGDVYVADSNNYGFGPGFVAMVDGTAITGTIASTQLQPGSFTTLANGDLAVTNTGFVDFGDFSDPTDDVVTEPGGIDIIDPGTNAVVDNIDLGLIAPGGALAVDGNFGYVVSGTEGTLLRVDMAAGTFTEIQVTDSGAFLSWVEVVNGKLYVLASQEDRIYVFDAATGEPEDSIQVGPGGATYKGPSHIAVWEDAGGTTHLFIAMYYSNSVTDVVLPD